MTLAPAARKVDPFGLPALTRRNRAPAFPDSNKQTSCWTMGLAAYGPPTAVGGSRSSVLGYNSYSNLVTIRPLAGRAARQRSPLVAPAALGANWQDKAQQRAQQHGSGSMGVAKVHGSPASVKRSKSLPNIRPHHNKACTTAGHPASAAKISSQQHAGAVVPLLGELQDLKAKPDAQGRFLQRENSKDKWSWTRRALLQAASAGGIMSVAVASAQASKFPAVVDRAWEAISGAPADLYFPDQFLGTWTVSAVLTSVEMPLGQRLVPNPEVVRRASTEDLNREITYQAAFIRNKQGRVIIDRRFNTSKLLQVYLGSDVAKTDDISWDPDDPNVLALLLPGGINVLTRVTKRSTSRPDGAENRLDTAEYFQQVFDTPGRIDPRVKASQCFTKYKWREESVAAADGGPAIIATQVISDYLTAYDGDRLAMEARDRPVVVYTYRLAFRRTAQRPITA